VAQFPNGFTNTVIAAQDANRDSLPWRLGLLTQTNSTC
jgi:hypothetical protein